MFSNSVICLLGSTLTVLVYVVTGQTGKWGDFQGVFFNLTKSDFEAKDWTLCYDEYYSDGTYASTLSSNCDGTNENVVWFVGSIETSISTTDIYMGAFIPATILLADDAAYQSTSADLYYNDVYWYYSPGYSIGFSGLSSTVYLYSCDTQDSSDNYRLCWHCDTGTGGYRSGDNTGLNSDSSNFKKIVYYKDLSINATTLAPSPPSMSPTRVPSQPTKSPSTEPTSSPTDPSNSPTTQPTSQPTDPTNAPSLMPTMPTYQPTAPTNVPSYAPTNPTLSPTMAPTIVDYYFNVTQNYQFEYSADFGCTTSGCSVTKRFEVAGRCDNPTLTVKQIETDYAASTEYTYIYFDGTYITSCEPLDADCTYDLVTCSSIDDYDASSYINSPNEDSVSHFTVTFSGSSGVNLCAYSPGDGYSYYVYGTVVIHCDVYGNYTTQEPSPYPTLQPNNDPTTAAPTGSPTVDPYTFIVGENGQLSKTKEFGCTSAGCSVKRTFDILGQCTNPSLSVSIMETDYASTTSEIAYISIDNTLISRCFGLDSDCSYEWVNCTNMTNYDLSDRLSLDSPSSSDSLAITLSITSSVNTCSYNKDGVYYYLYGSVTISCESGSSSYTSGPTTTEIEYYQVYTYMRFDYSDANIASWKLYESTDLNDTIIVGNGSDYSYYASQYGYVRPIKCYYLNVNSKSGNGWDDSSYYGYYSMSVDSRDVTLDYQSVTGYGNTLYFCSELFVQEGSKFWIITYDYGDTITIKIKNNDSGKYLYINEYNMHDYYGRRRRNVRRMQQTTSNDYVETRWSYMEMYFESGVSYTISADAYFEIYDSNGTTVVAGGSGDDYSISVNNNENGDVQFKTGSGSEDDEFPSWAITLIVIVCIGALAFLFYYKCIKTGKAAPPSNNGNNLQSVTTTSGGVSPNYDNNSTKSGGFFNPPYAGTSKNNNRTKGEIEGNSVQLMTHQTMSPPKIHAATSSTDNI